MTRLKNTRALPRPDVFLFIIVLLSGFAYLSEAQTEDLDFEKARLQMVQDQLENRDIEDPRVLEVMRKVPRHRFVHGIIRAQAYIDSPLPIGYGQTISQPYIVAFMTQALNPKAQDKVLEIGTGSGYQAAVLAEMVGEVYTIEIIEPLADRARETLKALGYENIHVRHGDGYQGWPSEAPFDAVIVTAAPETVPPALIEQLKEGGRMVIPVGTVRQELKLLIKKDGKLLEERLLPVRFVPMVNSG